jgi:hypothetical protein
LKSVGEGYLKLDFIVLISILYLSRNLERNKEVLAMLKRGAWLRVCSELNAFYRYFRLSRQRLSAQFNCSAPTVTEIAIKA